MTKVSTNGVPDRDVRPVRVRLLEAAARLLADEGPRALTTRRLASEVGASTMVVYHHFGGMPELVRAVIVEGFARLAEHMAAVPRTADPVADLGRLALAYRANARANPHLYAVMFGGVPLDGQAPPAEEPVAGRAASGAGTFGVETFAAETFGVLVEAAARAMDAGRLRRDDPEHVSAQLWSAVHGFVMLELAGQFTGGAETVLTSMLVNLGVGLGDAPDAAARSLRAALDTPAP
ncbi:WHG domain-containing protein [Actinomadura miaoliensis]|uniref:WHG domain-containing protein n=1 Tax=Actinomadura miaoliensis TaxID=430685 RepID=UPI0031EE7319